MVVPYFTNHHRSLHGFKLASLALGSMVLSLISLYILLVQSIFLISMSLSAGARCGDQAKPSIFTRLSSYLNWINDNINGKERMPTKWIIGYTQNNFNVENAIRYYFSNMSWRSATNQRVVLFSTIPRVVSTTTSLLWVYAAI